MGDGGTGVVGAATSRLHALAAQREPRRLPAFDSPTSPSRREFSFSTTAEPSVEIPARDSRFGMCIPGLRSRRLAGHPADQRRRLAGPQERRSTLRLYHNNGNGTFTDVTTHAGLDVELYGMGVAVGDYNNDGFPDILVTCVGQNRFQNINDHLCGGHH